MKHPRARQLVQQLPRNGGAAALLLLVLAGCGGGGGGGGSNDSGGGGSGDPSGTTLGNGCLDMNLATTAGTRVVVVLDGTSTAPSTKLLDTYDWTVTGPSTFNGTSATATRSVFTSQNLTSGAKLSQTTVDYSVFDTGTHTISQLGTESTSTVGGFAFSSKFVANPATLIEQWKLLPGKSLSYSWAGLSSSAGTNAPISGSATIRFIGFETITVPAGTYETCRFESVMASAPSLVNTHWYIKGSLGAFARMESASPSSTSQFVAKSITVNGKKL